jgi:hypothetical protein
LMMLLQACCCYTTAMVYIQNNNYHKIVHFNTSFCQRAAKFSSSQNLKILKRRTHISLYIYIVGTNFTPLLLLRCWTGLGRVLLVVAVLDLMYGTLLMQWYLGRLIKKK